MKHYFDIQRTGDSALVTVYEINNVNGVVSTGKTIASYETSSKGATKSARKTIKELEAN